MNIGLFTCITHDYLCAKVKFEVVQQ